MSTLSCATIITGCNGGHVVPKLPMTYFLHRTIEFSSKCMTLLVYVGMVGQTIVTC